MSRLFLLLPLLVTPFASADWNGAGYGHMGHGGFGGVGMFFGMALFWGLLVLAGVWLFRLLERRDPGSPSRDDAIDIIRRRYAQGELSEDEMAAMIDKLKS